MVRVTTFWYGNENSFDTLRHLSYNIFATFVQEFGLCLQTWILLCQKQTFFYLVAYFITTNIGLICFLFLKRYAGIQKQFQVRYVAKSFLWSDDRTPMLSGHTKMTNVKRKMKWKSFDHDLIRDVVENDFVFVSFVLNSSCFQSISI